MSLSQSPKRFLHRPCAQVSSNNNTNLVFLLLFKLFLLLPVPQPLQDRSKLFVLVLTLVPPAAALRG